MTLADCFVSVVAPLSDDALIVESFTEDVMGVLEANYANYELLLVDDGSRDDTAQKVAGLLRRFKCVRYIRLSRSFGVEAAIASGLDGVIGDYAVVMLPESDPPGLIPDLVRECRSGQGIVFGVRSDREKEPLPVRLLLGIFHAVSPSLFNFSLPQNWTHFMALSRQALNAVIQMKEKHRYLLLQSSYVGYDSRSLPYTPVHRYGKPKRAGFLKKLNMVFAIIVTNSKHPLRLVSWLGLAASLLNGLYVVYIVLIYFLKENVAEGWTTLSLQTAGMFFFVFLILTVLAEYVGRILDESRARPLYYIQEERNSSVLIADEERRNVATRSTLGDPTTEKD